MRTTLRRALVSRTRITTCYAYHVETGTCFSYQDHRMLFAHSRRPVTSALTVKKKVKWSYYQNVCTQSYSMWWCGT